MEEKENYLKISTQVGVSYFFNALIILIQPVLIALLTRTLSIQEYGVYSLLFVSVSLLSVIFRFGLVDYIRTKIPGLNEEKRVKNIVTILIFSLVLLLFVGVLLYFLKSRIILFLGIQKYTTLWIISIFIIVFITLNDLLNAYLTSIKKIFISSFLSFLTKSLWILLLILIFCLVGGISLNFVFILWLAGVAFSLVLTFYFIRHELLYYLENKQKFDFSLLRTALKFSLPLVFFVSFSFVIDLSDRYLINYFLGKESVAIYSLAYGLVSAIATIPLIFQTTISPYFAERWNIKKDPSLFFNILLKYSLIAVIPSMVGMFVMREEIITLISGNAYLKAAPLLSILLIYPLFAVLIEIFNKTLLLRDMIKHTVSIYLIGAIVSVAINIIFIPIFGIIAAAYSLIISYFVIFTILFYFRPKEITVKLNYIKPVRILIASAIMGIIIMPINPTQYWTKILVILMGVCIYLLFLFLIRIFNKEEKKLISYIYARYIKRS